MSPTLNFVCYFTGFMRRGADFTCMSDCQYVFQNYVKSRKIYMYRLRRYSYTHDQLNTRHFNIIF